MVISDERAEQFLREVMRENYFPNVTEADIPDFIDMYNRVKYEAAQQYKNESDLKTLLGNLVEAEDTYRRGEGKSVEAELNNYSDNKHMYIFDEILEDGESNNIIKALNENGLDSSALRGFKLYTRKQTLQDEDDINIQSLGNGIKVTTEYDEDVSFAVESLKIEYNGKVIYKWDRDNGFNWNLNFGIDEEEVTANEYDLAGYRETVDKRGVTHLRDKKGRFVRRV